MAWTEKKDFIGKSTSNWESHDLSGSPYNVPANAIIEVIMGHGNTGSEVILGIREYGSSQARYLALHEAEESSGGAKNWYTMHVQVDASSRFETYSNAYLDSNFYLSGYWDSGTYVSIAPVAYDALNDGNWDLVAILAAGAGSIAEIVMANEQKGAENVVGCREVGSSLERTISLHECEPGTADNTLCSIFVKTDSSKQVRLWSEDVSDTTFYCVGYWTTPPATWTEKFVLLNWNSTGGVWEDKDISSEMTGGAVGQFIPNNHADAANYYCGVRIKGSTEDRRYYVTEAEGGGRNPFTQHAQSDSSGYIQVYTTNQTQRVYLMGQWIIAGGVVKEIAGVIPAQSALSAQYVELLREVAGVCGARCTIPDDNLGVKYSVLGTIASVSNAENTPLKKSFDILGSLAAQSGADASLGLFKLLAGVIAGESTADGAIKLLMEIIGTSDGLSDTADVNLGVEYSILGEIDGQSGTTVSLDALKKIIGSLAAQSDVPDATLGLFKLFAGDIAGLSNVPDSSVELSMKLVGDIDGQSDLPALNIRLSQKLASLSEGQSATPALELKASRKLAGDIDALSTLTGTIEIQAVIPLAGSLAGQSNLPDADLKLAMKIIGTIDADSATTGAIKLSMELIGDTGGVSTADATLKAIRGLAGDVDALSTLSGTLQSIAYLLGTVAGTSGVDGGLKVTLQLVGVIDGQSVVLGTLTQITPYAIEITQITSMMSDLLTKITTERTERLTGIKTQDDDLITKIWTEM